MTKQSHLLLLFIVLMAFPQMSETIVTPSFPEIADALQTSHRLVEVSMSVFFGAFALGVSFWGVVSDWSGRRRALCYGLVVFVLGSFVCALCETINQLLVATALQAFGGSCGSVVTMTILRDVYHGRDRGRVFAVIGMALAFSPALGPLLGSFLVGSIGWRANYVFMMILGVILFGVCALGLPETRPEGLPKQTLKHVWKLMKIMIRDPFIWASIIMVALCNSVVFCFFGEGAFIFIGKLGVQPREYGWIGIVVSLAILVSGSLSHRLVGTRLTSEDLIRGGAIVLFVGALAYLGSSFAIMEAGTLGLKAAFLLVPSLFILFFGMGMMIPNCLSIALKDYQAQVGSAGSLFGFSYYVMISLMTAGMSALHGPSILILPMYLSVLGLIGVVVALTRFKTAS